jgi:hypothetical protein
MISFFGAGLGTESTGIRLRPSNWSRWKRTIEVKIPACPLVVWKKLYDAAIALREIEPWQWMSDSQVFGVQNPEDKEIGYCCVLGALGEVLGLVVYLGTAGLEQHRKIQSGKIRAGSPTIIHGQSCLTAWFSNRGDLDKTDIKIATQVGLKPRGRAAWPQFRSFRPGYHPWFLTENEAKYLTLCLEQTREMALRLRTNPEWLAAPSRGRYRVRVPVENPDPAAAEASHAAHPAYSESLAGQPLLFADLARSHSWEWGDQWLKPAPLPEPVIRSVPLDEVRLQRIKNASRGHHGIWEIDADYMTEAVEGDKRPFLPYMLLCADHDSGFILATVLAEPSTWESEFTKTILECLEQHKLLPEKLWLRKEALRALFEPSAAQLGVGIEMTNKLTAVPHAKREVEKFTKRRH